jgi:hypothetical protein
MNFPKYIYTLQDDRFKKLKEDIILIGKYDGIIYVKTKNKEELFEKIQSYTDRNEKICCYNEYVEFTLIEMKILLYFNVKIVRNN